MTDKNFSALDELALYTDADNDLGGVNAEAVREAAAKMALNREPQPYEFPGCVFYATISAVTCRPSDPGSPNYVPQAYWLWVSALRWSSKSAWVTTGGKRISVKCSGEGRRGKQPCFKSSEI